MMNYIDLLLEEQLERQEREKQDGAWNGETVRVPLPRQEEPDIQDQTPAAAASAEQPETRREEEEEEAQGRMELPVGTAGGLAATQGRTRTQEQREEKRQSERFSVVEEAGRVEHNNMEWTARRWIAGQAVANQAGMRMAEVRQTAREGGRADLLPDAPKAGQREETQAFDPSEGYPGELAEAMMDLVETADLEQEAFPNEDGVYTAGRVQLRRMAGVTDPAAGSGNTGAGWLDQAVRVSLEGLPAPERESKVVTLEPAEWNGGAGRLELRQLDRLVRRDARRFDGGFQLL